jgi:hypothetical protein
VLQLANVARARRPVRNPAAANWGAIAANFRTVCHTDGALMEREAFYTQFYE